MTNNEPLAAGSVVQALRRAAQAARLAARIQTGDLVGAKRSEALAALLRIVEDVVSYNARIEELGRIRRAPLSRKARQARAFADVVVAKVANAEMALNHVNQLSAGLDGEVDEALMKVRSIGAKWRGLRARFDPEVPPSRGPGNPTAPPEYYYFAAVSMVVALTELGITVTKASDHAAKCIEPLLPEGKGLEGVTLRNWMRKHGITASIRAARKRRRSSEALSIPKKISNRKA